MSVTTGIQWTDATWNPVRGCSRVSPGCHNCYAERTAARFIFKGVEDHGDGTRTAQAGPFLGFLITGSFVIEQIFAIPGIGRFYVSSVTARDYSVVMGLTVLLSVIIILANMVVDILYGFLDPRTRDART